MYSFEPAGSQRFPAEASSGSVKLSTSVANCGWTVSSSESWLRLTSPTNGTGEATIAFSLTANATNVLRRANLIVGGQTYLIEQGAPGGFCTVTPLVAGVITQGQLAPGDCWASGTTRVPADVYKFTGLAGQPVALTYFANELSGNLTLRSPLGQVILQSNGSSTFVRIPTGATSFNLPQDGEYQVEVSSNGMFGAYTVELYMLPADCNAATIAPAKQSFNATGGSATMQVAVRSACVWQASASVDWITLEAGQNQLGSQTLRYSVAPNSGSARTATLIAAGSVLQVEQAGAGGSCAPTPLSNGQTLRALFGADDCQATGRRTGSNSPTPTKRYSFTAEVGQRLVTLVQPLVTNSEAPVIFLLNTEGRLLGASDRLSAFANNTYLIPATGTYLLELERGAGFELHFALLNAGCGLTLSQPPSQFAAAGGTSTLQVTTPTNCRWQASTAASWVSLNAATSNTGSGSFSFTISPNLTNQARRATLYVNGQPHLIEQAGVGGTCSVRVISTAQAAISDTLGASDCFSRTRQAAQYQPLHRAKRFQFTANAGQNLSLRFSQMTLLSAHLQLFNRAGQSLQAWSNVNNGSRMQFILPDTDEYTLELTTGYGDQGGSFTMQFALGQANCPLQITPASLGVNAAASSATVQMTTNAGCQWTARTEASWLTMQTGATGSGTGTVRIAIAANESALPRRGTVVIDDQIVTIEQAGVGGTCAIEPLTLGTTRTGTLTNADCRRGNNLVNGFINPPAVNWAVKRFALSLTAGAVLAIKASKTNLEAGLVLVTLYDPSGNIAAESNLVSFPRLPNTDALLIQQTGNYVLEITGTATAYDLAITGAPAPGCHLTLAEREIRLGAAGGNASVALNAAANCGWQVFTEAAWLTFANAQSSGAGRLSFSAAANSQAQSRAALVYVNGQILTVQQAGTGGNCGVTELLPNVTLDGRLDQADCDGTLGVSLAFSNNSHKSERYRFNYSAGQRIAVQFQPPANAPANGQSFELYLFDPQGRLLTRTFTNPARVPATANTYLVLPTAGTYELEVRAPLYTNGNYRVTLLLATACELALTTDTARLNADAQSGSVAVVTAALCPWRATLAATPDASNWLTLNEGTNLGSATQGFRLSANTDSPNRARRGVMQFTSGTNATPGQEFTVWQAGADGTCAIQTLPASNLKRGTIDVNDCPSLYYLAASGSISLAANAEIFQFQGQAGDRVTLIAAPQPRQQNGWPTYTIALANGRALQEFSGTSEVETPAPTITLPVTGTYHVEAAHRSDTHAAMNYGFGLYQQRATCASQISNPPRQNLLTAEANSVTGELSVASLSDCPWQAYTIADWITLTNASGTGNGTIRYVIAGNLSPAPRHGSIFLGTQRIVVWQAGRNGGTCSITPLTPGQLVRGTLQSGDCAYASKSGHLTNFGVGGRRYSFTGRAGERLNAFLLSESGELRLYSPTGALLLFNESRNNYEPLRRLPENEAEYYLPMDGTYWLDVVNNYNVSSISYQLLVSLQTTCVYRVTSLNNRIDQNGGSGSAQINTLSGCAWTAHSLTDWLTLSNASGTGSGIVQFTATANATRARRRGYVVIGNQIFTVDQGDNNGTCSARAILPAQIVSGELRYADCTSQFGNMADRYRFTAAANQQLQVQFFGGARPNLALFDAAGNLLVQNSVAPQYAPNVASNLPDKGAFLLPGAGEYQLEVAGGGEYGYAFVLSLTPLNCYTTVAPGLRRYDAAGTTGGTFTVTSSANCPWTAYSNDSWLTLTNASGSGNGTITFTVAPLPTGSSFRQGAILLGDQRVEVQQGTDVVFCEPLMLNAGQTYSGELSYLNCERDPISSGNALRHFRFAAQAGDHLNALLTLSNELAAFIKLYDPLGQLLYQYSSVSPAITLTRSKIFPVPATGSLILPKTGNYHIEIRVEAQTNFSFRLDLQPTCSYSANFVSPNPATFAVDGGTGQVTVTTENRCAWALNGDVPWITSTAGGTGNGTGTFTIAPNPDPLRRTGRVLFPGGSLSVTQPGRATAVSAASYRPNQLAPNAIGALFGQGLAPALAVATITPLPTSLANTSMWLRDSANQEHAVPLFAVSPGQINFLVPAASALGDATFQVLQNDFAVAGGTLKIVGLAPGLFAANADGQGPPAGAVLRVRNGVQAYEPLVQFDAATNRYRNLPLNLGTADDQVFLVLFGTGWRSVAASINSIVTIGGLSVPVLYADAQGSLLGLDQLNVRLPRELSGRGLLDVRLIVNGVVANLVQISVQ